jgi:tyrosine-protein kinase Etk/Wzc
MRMNDRTRLEPETRPAAPQPVEHDDEIDLAELVGVVREGKWLVLAVWALVLLAAIAYLLLAPPVYRAEAVLQVKEATPSVTSVTDTIQSLLEGTSKADTEIQILQSRTLATQVVDATKLYIDAHPRWFPLVGRAIARRYDDPGLRAPLLGLTSYAWGGERITVDQFEVPKKLQEYKYRLVAGAGGAYTLYDPDGNLVLEGQVGRAAAQGGVRLYVSELVARPGTGFVVVRNSREDTVDDLIKNMQIAERGKDTGIIGVDLEGTDPAQIQAVIEDYANFYVRNNAELKSQQAAQMLGFIQKQLPDLRARAEQAEDAINRYQTRHGSVNVTLQAKDSLEKLADIEKQIADVQLKKVELVQRFTSRHPNVVAMDEQLQELESKRDRMTDELRKLPNNEWDTVRLLRDVKVATELYTSMLNKGQELGIAKAGALGDARVVDHPILPETPVKPKAGLVLAIAFVLGAMLGVMVLFARRALNPAVRGPDELEQAGLPVYATVPHARRQERLHEGKGLKPNAGPPLLALHYGQDMAVESLRSLRSSLHFALMEATNNVVAISGHAPGVGKTFVCANLAALLAASGKRVLVIDADLRKGALHQYLGGERAPGLSDVVSGQMTLEAATRRIEGCESLYALTGGTIPPNPSELLMSERFARLLEEVSKAYDLVLIDTPPVLAVTDAAVVGRLCGALLFVVRAKHHSLREILLAVHRLRQNGVSVNGAVLNDVASGRSRYGYVYQYEYGASK